MTTQFYKNKTFYDNHAQGVEWFDLLLLLSWFIHNMHSAFEMMQIEALSQSAYEINNYVSMNEWNVNMVKLIFIWCPLYYIILKSSTVGIFDRYVFVNIYLSRNKHMIYCSGLHKVIFLQPSCKSYSVKNS